MHPHKKPRLMPAAVPDGFEKSPAQPRVKIPVPHFASAFAQSSSATKPHSKTKPPRSSLDPQLGSSASSEYVTRKALPVTDLLVAEAHPTARLSLAASRPDPFVAFKDVSHKRSLQQNLHAHVDDLFAPHTPLKRLQASEFASVLHEYGEDAEKLTKRIGSPPKLSSNGDPKHPFTLSTTGIACATDISTDSGNAELASIFLYDQHPEILQGEENGGEAQRGLNFSPQKKRYARDGPQFVRNGLASRASLVLGRLRTSLTLWEKEMEKQAIPDAFSHLRPDLRMTIVKIEHMPVPTFTKSNSTSLGIALCRIHAPSDQVNISFTTSYHKLFKVIFSFPLPASQSPVRSASHFAVGAEVFAWKPLQEVKLAPVLGTAAGSDSAVQQYDIPAPLPASFPMLLTFSSPGEASRSIADSVLLCNRFLFMR